MLTLPKRPGEGAPAGEVPNVSTVSFMLLSTPASGGEGNAAPTATSGRKSPETGPAPTGTSGEEAGQMNAEGAPPSSETRGSGGGNGNGGNGNAPAPTGGAKSTYIVEAGGNGGESGPRSTIMMEAGGNGQSEATGRPDGSGT